MISRATRKNLIRPNLSTKMHQRKVDTQHPLSIKKYLHHHKPTRYVNVTAEIQPGAHSTVNVFQKTLFIKQLCQQLLIHITAVVKISSFTTTTIQNHFATNIVETIQNFLNIYGTLKTKEFIVTQPRALLLMSQHTDVVQDDVISVLQKSTSQHVSTKKNLLNKSIEIISKCRHRKKFILKKKKFNDRIAFKQLTLN